MSAFLIKYKKKILAERTFRYMLSGLIAFSVENISFLSFYYLAGLSVVTANISSIIIAVAINFFMTKHFVFNSKTTKKESFTQAVSYFILVACNTVVSTYMIVRLIEFGVEGYIAKPVVTVAVITWTYIIYSIIFKKGTK